MGPIPYALTLFVVSFLPPRDGFSVDLLRVEGPECDRSLFGLTVNLKQRAVWLHLLFFNVLTPKPAAKEQSHD